MSALVFGVLFFGAVHTWVYTVVFLIVAAVSFLLLEEDVVREGEAWHFRWIKTDLTPLFLAFFAYLIIQMIPLPRGLLLLISPEAKVDALVKSRHPGESRGPAIL